MEVSRALPSSFLRRNSFQGCPWAGGPSELKHLSKITLWIAPKGRVEKIQLSMSSSFFPSFSPAFPEGKFLDVSGTKILILLLHALRNHLHQLILLSPLWFIGLEISTSTAESRWGLGFVYIISLFSCSFSYFSLLIYKYIFSP